MKSLFLLLVLTNIALFSSAQYNLYFNTGIGVSTFEGYSFLAAVSYNKQNNEFTLRRCVHKETGRSVQGLLGKQSLNDRYVDYSLLYSRSWRKWKWLYLSMAGGVGFHNYSEKKLGSPVGWSSWEIITKNYTGFNLSAQANAFFIFGDDFGLSISVPMAFLPNVNVGGVTIGFVVGNLTPQNTTNSK